MVIMHLNNTIIKLLNWFNSRLDSTEYRINEIEDFIKS